MLRRNPLDRTLLCDTTGGGFTGTLPDATNCAVEYVFKNVGANTLTVATTSSQLIYTTSGTGATTAEPAALQGSTNEARVIYDDQYLSTLISLGGFGFIGVVWFLWGGVRKLGRSAKKSRGPLGELLLACTASTAAFGVGMLTYDALAFVQVSLLFFVVCGLGLRARALVEHE